MLLCLQEAPAAEVPRFHAANLGGPKFGCRGKVDWNLLAWELKYD